MALFLIEGELGSGKTLLGLQKFLVPAIEKGRNVYTNIDGIDYMRVCGSFNIDPIDIEDRTFKFDPDDITAIQAFYKSVKYDSLILIDEGQNYFGSRSWDSKESKELIPYLTKSRHNRHDLIVITPNINLLDVSFRRVASLTYRVKPTGKYLSGISKKSNQLMNVQIFDRADVDFPAKPLSSNKILHDIRIYRIYKTVDKDGEADVKQEVNLLPSFKAKLFLFLFIAGIVLAYVSIKGTILDTTKEKKTITEVSKKEDQSNNETNDIDGCYTYRISTNNGNCEFKISDRYITDECEKYPRCY